MHFSPLVASVLPCYSHVVVVVVVVVVDIDSPNVGTPRLRETSKRIVILVINIVIAQIAIPIQSLPSGPGFYACEVGKT